MEAVGRRRPRPRPGDPARRPAAAGRRGRRRALAKRARFKREPPGGAAAGGRPRGGRPPTRRPGTAGGSAGAGSTPPRPVARVGGRGGRRPGRRRLPDRLLGAVAGHRGRPGADRCSSSGRPTRGSRPATRDAAWPPTWAPARPARSPTCGAAPTGSTPARYADRTGGPTSDRTPPAVPIASTVHGSHDDPTTRGPGRAPGAGPERRLAPGGGEAPRQGQDDRPGAHRLPARRRLVPGARHAGPPPGPRHGPRGEPALHRRGDHRVRHHRRPPGLRVQPGLHRLRRRPGRGVRREDPQGDGPGLLHRRADDRPQRRRRRPHPGGRGLPPLLRRHLPPQRPGLRGDPPDQRHPRARAPAARSTARP